MNNILHIKAMSAPWQGLNYSVSWDGRGVVAQPNGIKSIWDCAFKACTKGFRVGFSFGEQAVAIDAMTMQAGMRSTEYLHHLVQRHGGISSVAFEYREEAERFVDELDKIIMWKLLKRDFDEQH
jgi:hypothetical protein